MVNGRETVLDSIQRHTAQCTDVELQLRTGIGRNGGETESAGDTVVMHVARLALMTSLPEH